MSFIKEACVENLQQAIIAEKQGADRLELCTDLEMDGLTPSNDLILKIKEHIKIPVHVMIRPRAGNFVYSVQKIDEMKASIAFCKLVGVEGVVFGILNNDNTLNLDKLRELTDYSQPLKVVIHKAIDDTPNPLQACKELADINGVTTILSSGGEITALEGMEVLREMIKISSEIEIMPAGKITKSNVHELHELIGARAYHGRLIVGSLEGLAQ
ncbi:copper homeostasis protein CutC [Salinimicrobium sp. 3283s]|uniref:copper homeostasis protein CutC n=1 Tax=Salinimicrobium sp. 3283s TaxID=3114359 RepID=UPI0031EE803C